jgi:hypothetical protein
LLENVNLQFYQYKFGAVSASMANVLPFFTKINSIDVDTNMIALFQNEYSELAMPMLTSARVLQARFLNFLLKNQIIMVFSCNLQHQHHCDFFFRWLHTPREDKKSRILHLRHDIVSNEVQSINSFVEQIKQVRKYIIKQ